MRGFFRSALWIALCISAVWPGASVAAGTLPPAYGPDCVPFEPSTATSPAAVVFACPAGDGPSLADQAAVVTVRVRACPGVPLVNFPSADVWLTGASGASLSACQGGTAGDANSDADGVMLISHPLGAGGWTDTGVLVVVGGQPISASVPLQLSVHSPDITGDGRIDLADVGPFSADLSAQAGFRSDFHADGRVGLADVGIFSAHLGHTCP